MLSQDLLALFLPVTPEEEHLLKGEALDSSLYSAADQNVITANKLLRDGKLITLRSHTRFVRFPEHIHDYVELVYMCQGSTHHIINGNILTLREGELLFLGQNARQEILPAGEEDIALNFIILPAFFHRSLELLGTEDTPIKRFLIESLFNEESPGYLHFKVSEIPTIQNLMENLIRTLLENAPNKRSISQTTMALLFMQLLNHTDRLAYQTKEEAALLQIYRYIEEHYCDGTLTDAAETFHYDLFWLSRLLPRLTGKTYTQLLQEKRLNQAAYLLKNTRLTVDQIALAVGYENKSYFYRLFTAQFGTTPLKYKKR